jgi:hypothetical protein
MAQRTSQVAAGSTAYSTTPDTTADENVRHEKEERFARKVQHGENAERGARHPPARGRLHNPCVSGRESEGQAEHDSVVIPVIEEDHGEERQQRCQQTRRGAHRSQNTHAARL